MAPTFLSLCLLLCFGVRLSFSGQSSSMESVPDLQKSMYKVVDGYPCVRLLSLSGPIGCSNPGRDKVVAPIVTFKNANQLSKSSAILVSSDEFESLLTRISGDSSFASKVAGVLVESGAGVLNKLKGFSPELKFPQVEFAPYDNTGYQWNPTGSGIMWRSYNFPVFLLSDSSTETLHEFDSVQSYFGNDFVPLEIFTVWNHAEVVPAHGVESYLFKQVATKNENNMKGYTANVAEFDLVMQVTKSGNRGSESCLEEATCLPLGGYSVWSSLPPINISSFDHPKPIILTMASMDSASFFRDKNLGAESPISGLIALLAAVDALSHVNGLGDLTKQLVFVVFTGEAWGYLGSRRFLHELDMHSDAVHGLNNSQIEMVIEIGSVGKGFNEGAHRFFPHTSGVSSATNETLSALRHAQESLLSENIKITSPSDSNPGIPPSSLMAFLKKNPGISGIVLEDFDAVFTNKFYHSHLDDSSNVNSSAIVAAASLVARTLYILASEKENVQDSALPAINVNASLVEELIGCLLTCDPGLSCELVKSYISPSSICPSHYVGVIMDEPSSTPYPGYINDVPRFIWNFLSDKTSISKENGRTSCQEDCKSRDEVCIKAETDGKGVCVTSTTRYVPAYSTRLKYESGVWNVLPPNASDDMGAVDPVWTESNWNTIGIQVYTIQDAAYDRLVLFGGITITILAYVAIVIIRAFITKTMKRD